jgi:glycosyltransferase involved in cell wall biosynthesis
VFGVSAVIPAYNAQSHVRRAILSINNQIEPVLETIVVDDGSTDGTASIVRTFGDRVRYVHQENGGPAAARNRGIREARGEWIAFLDADDEWAPAKVRLQLALIDRFPELRWVAGNLLQVRRGLHYPGLVPAELREQLRDGGVVRLFDGLSKGLLFPSGSFLIHRDVFRKAGLFDTTLRTAEDRDMWWRIAMQWPEIGYVADPIFLWHVQTPGSLSKSSNDRTTAVRIVRDNARRAKELGPEVWRDFESYGRLIALDYQARVASGEITTDGELLIETAALFPTSLRERLTIATLGSLPRPLAKRLSYRLQPRAIASRVSQTPAEIERAERSISVDTGG